MLTPETPANPTNDFSAIKKRIDNSYSLCRAEWERFQTEALINLRLEAGDASLNRELSNTPVSMNRNEYVFNRTRPMLNMIYGKQIQNRKSTIVIPLENAPQQTADQLTRIISTIYRNEDVYPTISEAFHMGACITGLSLLHVYLDFRNDPISGDIRIEHVPFNAIFVDPYFRKQDLSDCSFIWRRSYVTYSQAVSLLPSKKDEIMEMQLGGSQSSNLRFQYMPESYGIMQKNRLAYDEYYYRDYRTQKLLVDKQTGETLDVSNRDTLDIDAFLNANPQVTLIKQTIPTVRLAIMIQDTVLSDGPQPSGIDEYCFVPVIGYYSSNLPNFYNRIQGVATSLRDPQLLLNRRIMLNAILLESQASSGWIFKENAVVDIKHLFNTGEGRIIPIKAEAQMTDIQQIMPPVIPPSHFEQETVYEKAMGFCTGVNEEMMGNPEDLKIAGILASLRMRAGMITLEPLFEKLNISQNLLGNRVVAIIQRNFTPGKVKAMLGGQEPTPFFYNKEFGKYQCALVEGFDTDTQKQMEFAQLVQLTELGLKLPQRALINAATLQNKSSLIREIEQAEQQEAQMAQAQAQAEIQESEARIKLTNARATADTGLGVERISRVHENEQLAVERRAQAEKEKTESLLAFARAMKELEGLDVTHLEQLINMYKIIKEPTNTENPHEGTKKVQERRKTPQKKGGQGKPTSRKISR